MKPRFISTRRARLHRLQGAAPGSHRLASFAIKGVQVLFLATHTLEWLILDIKLATDIDLQSHCQG